MTSTLYKATAFFIVGFLIVSLFTIAVTSVAKADNSQGNGDQQSFDNGHNNGDQGYGDQGDRDKGDHGSDWSNDGDQHDGNGYNGSGDDRSNGGHDRDSHDNDHGRGHGHHDGDSTPSAPTTGSLVVIKVVSGGTATADQFSFSINNAAAVTFNSSGENDFLSMATGTYSVVESATTTYTPSYNNCSAVLVVAGATTTCTITNTFVTPPAPVDLCPNIEGTQASVPDGMTVNSDGNCVTPAPAPVVTNNSNGGGGGGGGGGGWSGGCTTYSSGETPWWGAVPCSNTTPMRINGGYVLGASTGPACSALLTTYLGYGKKNNSDEVKKLQTFLNSEIGAGLTVSGVYDKATTQAVKQFQLKYQDEVLAPWKQFGLADHSATGYVYKTTLRKINLLSCASLNLPTPSLP